MSEPNAQTAPETDPAQAGTDAPGEVTEGASDEHGAAGDMFPRSYVEQLRAEAGEHRVKAQRADSLAASLMVAVRQNAVGDLLRSADDLPDGDYLDEDGLPDPAKIRAAAEELILTKPWLARPRGEVGQGPRVEPDTVSLAGLLREAAR